MLGLSQGCSSDEIRRAYRTLALQHHPDRNPGNEEAAAQLFQLIGEVTWPYSWRNTNNGKAASYPTHITAFHAQTRPTRC